MSEPTRASIPVIAWRFIWVVPLAVSAALFIFFVFCMYGLEDAKQAYRTIV